MRTTLRSDDALETRDFLEQTYGAQLDVGATPGPVGFRLEHLQAGPVSMTEIDLPLDLGFRVVGRGECVITTVLSGTAAYERDGELDRIGRGDVYLAAEPSGERDVRTGDIHSGNVTLPVSLLGEVARTDPDGARVDVAFTSCRPTPDGARRWRQVTRLVETTLADGAGPLVVGPATRLLAATALDAFPNTAVAPARARDATDGHPATLRRAVAFVDANPDLDLTLADIARAAAVTPRAIQLAFRRHLDTTPTRYLRQVRLQHAHDQLSRAVTEDGLTVTRVAMDWGFANAGRFARQYREVYGRPPSETLAD